VTVGEYPDVPDGVLGELSAICLALPEAYQETAWRGIRWRIRSRTFAHVLAIDEDEPSVYVRAAGPDGAATLLTFQCPADEIDALVRSGHPFFKPDWSPTIVGMVIEADVDWTEVTELLTESYCLLAPKKLVTLVDRPGPV
jgi:predicted DNA-binding protein (MmcQ/YjbR family)